MANTLPIDPSSIKNPYALLGLLLLVLEGALGAWLAIADGSGERVVAGILMAVVLLAFLWMSPRVIRSARADVDEVLNHLERTLPQKDQEFLKQLDESGEFEYRVEDRDKYKHLRNRGLVQTISGQRMKDDTHLRLTPFGALVVNALHDRDQGATRQRMKWRLQ